MGLTQSMSPEQKLAHINKLHDNIELIMKFKSRQMSYQDKKFVEQTYRSLMRCMFHEQVTNARLLECLHEHIDKWVEMNGVTLNKDKYVVEKYSHMKNYLDIYLVEVLRHDD